MLSKAVQNAINEQMKKEFDSSYLYLAMSAYCEANNLPGSAHWMRVQAREELSHAMKLFDYVNNQGGRVTLQAISQPPAEYKSLASVFQQVLEHERGVTASINRLYALALKENDYATQVELQWFISEQVEEEKTASQIVEQLKLVGDHSSTLLFLDRHLASRQAGK